MSILVGHGRLGSESALRDFIDLVDESVHQKDLTVEIRPILEVSGWTLESGTTFVIPFEQFFDGTRIDVVGVKSLLDTGLVRVETLQACRDTPGSFFYDVDVEFADISGLMITQWDILGAFWDLGGPDVKWDQFPRLFVHLFDSSNPNSTTTVIKSGFFYSNRSMVQPSLGPSKELNGGFENWTDGMPDNWIGSATTVEFWDDTVTDWDDAGTFWDPVLSFATEEISDVRVGNSALRMEREGSESVTETQTIMGFVIGKNYRISGSYSIDHRSGVTRIQIKDTSTSSWIGADGRSTVGTAHNFEFFDTAGKYRRFIIDFRAHAVSIDLSLIAQGTGSGVIVTWDDIKVRRIWRFNRYEPRLSVGDVPRSQSGSNDIFFGGKRIGTGGITLLNNDGQLEKLIAQFEWMNQEVVVSSGGVFSDGQEIHIEDYRQTFNGLIQSIEVTDDECSFSLQDVRAFFHINLPDRVYDDVEFPNMNTQKSIGKVRPIFFGVKENIDPVRIDKTANSYGIYEICDAEKAPNGMKAINTVYSYLDVTAAGLQRADQRLQLVLNTDFSMNLATGVLTVLRDIGPYEITDENNQLDFDEGGSELTAVLTEGVYAAEDLAVEVQIQMRAVGSSDNGSSYSESTHKITIDKVAGTLNLRIKSGTNKTTGPWRFLGYKPSADKTGSLSYEAENVLFNDVDRDHTIRVDAQGVKDDASGTFTGVAHGLIDVGADITRALLVKYMNKSSTIIDEVSFLFARERAPESLAIYLNESTLTKNIFDRLEFSNIANIVVNGEGKVFYKVYVGIVPDGIKTIEERDIREFSSSRSVTDIFNTIRINHDKDPTTGQFQTRQAEDNSVQIRLGRPDIREFETYIKRADNAISAANRLLELSRTAARKISVGAIGGKFVDLEVGDKVKLNRKRALSIGGVINNEVFRIISVSKAQQEGEADFELTDDRVTVASQACISSCQAFCQSTCQELCQQACQTTCQLNTQDGCESSCQQECQIGCQDTCQIGCQQDCQLQCQDTCQLVCQGVCESSGCQTNCETASCQLACQLSCQTTCQGSCQGACQTGCQDLCQVTCQTAKEQECTQACQTTPCQLSCQLNCQDSCQFSCQDTCQTSGCQTQSEGG